MNNKIITGSRVMARKKTLLIVCVLLFVLSLLYRAVHISMSVFQALALNLMFFALIWSAVFFYNSISFRRSIAISGFAWIVIHVVYRIFIPVVLVGPLHVKSDTCFSSFEKTSAETEDRIRLYFPQTFIWDRYPEINIPGGWYTARQIEEKLRPTFDDSEVECQWVYGKWDFSGRPRTLKITVFDYHPSNKEEN